MASSVLSALFGWRASPNFNSVESRNRLCFRKPAVQFCKPGVRCSMSSSVCNSESPAAPWLMLPPMFRGGEAVYKFYSLRDKKVFKFKGAGDGETEIVGSSHGFLALFNKRNHDLFLYNPISGSRIDLPSLRTLRVLNDFRAAGNDTLVTKLIFSGDDHGRAVMIFGAANRMAFCCPGFSTEWTPIGHLFQPEEKPTVKGTWDYRDIVYSLYYGELPVFICLNEFGVEVWYIYRTMDPELVNNVYDRLDINTVKLVAPKWWLDIDNINREVITRLSSCYIVYMEENPDESHMYVVLRIVVERSVYKKNINRLPLIRNWDDDYPYKTIGFIVFRAYLIDGVFSLESLNGSLDGLVMFLGTNHSFALPAANYPQFKPDSIYFTDIKAFTPLDWQTYGDHDSGIYDCVNMTFSPLQYPQGYDVGSIQGTVQPPVWFTPTHI